jgi:chromate transport protein ChrA
MDTSIQINPTRKYDRLAIISFLSGLVAMLFPIISVVFLITLNGGPGYLQSIFLGIPVAFVSIITGIVSLASRSAKNQKGDWMAVLGIIFGILFFAISYVLVIILLFPYLLSIAR